MKDNITNRDDIFLAKIAGKDVDIKTMTPPVAASMREKLMLDIADRIDSIEAGSGGGTYEKIIGTIGSSEKDGDLYFGDFVIDEAPDIKADSEVRLNGLSLVPIPDAGAKPSFYLNLDLVTFVPTGTPAYFVEIENATVTVGCDTDIGGETVTLEYKNSSEGSVDDVFTIHYTVDPQTSSVTSTETAGEAFAAAERGATIVATSKVEEESKSDKTYMWSMALYLTRTSDGAYIAYCTALASGQVGVIRLDAASADDVFTGSLPT